MCSGASLPLNVFGNVLVMTTPGYSFFTHGPWLLNVALVRFGFLAPTLTTVGPVHGAYSAKPAGYSGAMSASLPADATMTTPRDVRFCSSVATVASRVGSDCSGYQPRDIETTSTKSAAAPVVTRSWIRDSASSRSSSYTTPSLCMTG